MHTTEIQKQLAIDQHSVQAAEFAERYRRIDEESYRSCFAYSRKRLGGLLDSCLPEQGDGLRVLDVGCGRADFFDHLNARRTKVARYVGLEAVPALVDAARAKARGNVQIVEGDFVADPQRLRVGAQVIVMSGSLNTLESAEFYSTLRHAYDAADEMLVFNFLCSTSLAGASYLRWHPLDEVLKFAQTLGPRVRTLEDYLPGDCTVGMMK